MKTLLKSSAMVTFATALTLSFAGAVAAQQTGPSAGAGKAGGGYNDNGPGNPGTSEGPDEWLLNRHQRAEWPNDPYYPIPKYVEYKQEEGGSCAFLYTRINRDNALFTVPKYRECLRRTHNN